MAPELDKVAYSIFLPTLYFVRYIGISRTILVATKYYRIIIIILLECENMLLHIEVFPAVRVSCMSLETRLEWPKIPP